MELSQIKKHWENLAIEHGQGLGATTKTATIKKLEINALIETIKNLYSNIPSNLNFLEVGCGNGFNCFAVAEAFPEFKVTGVDYIPQMIENANKTLDANKNDNLRFYQGDILELNQQNELDEKYQIVFTNRCLINLNTFDLQIKALTQLTNKLDKNGYVILIENSTTSHSYQNDCRESIGLDRRTPDKYNLFIDESELVKYAQESLNLKFIEINDFASLHDLLLYVLLPKLNENKIIYDHPLMNVVTEMLLSTSLKFKNNHGDFGQNRLFLFQKTN